MDLYAGLPYWIVKNPLWNYFNPLSENKRFRVAIVGSGITGTLVAHELCRQGIECCVVDKRSLSTGSSVASTGLIQYEIDVPLCEMVEMMPEKDAVTAYHSCLESISELKRLLKTAHVEAAYQSVPTVYYASNHKGLRMLEKEYKARSKHGLPAELLTRSELFERMHIHAPGALTNDTSAQIDAYEASTGLLNYTIEKYGLPVYTHTEITDWEQTPKGYVLKAANGYKIECDYVVVAVGFESMPFLPEKLMELTSTFAIISQPVDEKELWHRRSLLWETRSPYLYIRTDDSNRIIVGGEDIPYNSASARKFLLGKKAATLEKKFRKLFPDIPFETEMAWAGTFSSTKDGLPLIGATADNPRMLFALGYGGNGITFSVIASQLLAGIIQGKKDPRTRIFGLGRKSLQ